MKYIPMSKYSARRVKPARVRAVAADNSFFVRQVLFLLLAVALLLCAPLRARAVAPESPRITPVVRAVQTVAPAVVNITSTHIVEGQRLSPLEQFFGPGFSGLPGFDLPGGRPVRQKRVSLGSGVIVDGAKGLVLTNAHVIEGGDEVMVHLLDGREFPASVKGADPDFDIAVLQIRGASNLPAVRMKPRYDDLDEYIADLKAEIAQNDQCATHYYNLGLALLTKRDFVAAEEAFLNAVRNSPHLAEAYVQLGGICLERGDLEGCLRYNEEAANCRAKFPVPLSNIAFVHLQRGEPDKAIKALTKALKWDPNFVQARNALATAYYMLLRPAASFLSFRPCGDRCYASSCPSDPRAFACRERLDRPAGRSPVRRKKGSPQ